MLCNTGFKKADIISDPCLLNNIIIERYKKWGIVIDHKLLKSNILREKCDCFPFST